jgi:hypothetical protein
MTAETLEMSPVRARVCLQSGGGMSFKDAAGVVLTPLRGRAWLTMEGDPRDIDLRPGVAYRIERDGLTLVNALETSLVEVGIPQVQRARWGDWPERVWDWLRRAGEARARARMAQGNYRL